MDFYLVVDDFGVKYVDEENARHLIDSLKEEFTISEDWKGDYTEESTSNGITTIAH